MDVAQAMTSLETAFKVLRSMPQVKVRNRFCNWPDILRSFWECYGSDAAKDNLRVPFTPTARQMSTMDRVINHWIPELVKYDTGTVKILWARAEGNSWKDIAYMAGRDPRTCRSDATIGLFMICMWENEGKFRG